MLALSSLALPAAFAAGVISFLSPCVLPLVPGYVSYIAGTSMADAPERRGRAGRLATLGLSLAFVAGFSSVFVALGAGATAIGQLLLRYKEETSMAGGAIVILFGLFMIGLLKMPWLHRDLRYHGDIHGGRALGAYLIGVAFAFGWSPCIGPVLGVILTMSAAASTVSNGVALLGVYSLGLGIPFVATAMFTDHLAGRLRFARRYSRHVQVGAGAGMVLMGVAMITGWLTSFAFWLLDTFPAFAAIG